MCVLRHTGSTRLAPQTHDIGCDMASSVCEACRSSPVFVSFSPQPLRGLSVLHGKASVIQKKHPGIFSVRCQSGLGHVEEIG